MSTIVVGTAGHIDHGKTTLIKALTGIETDTTKEEKNRGMSINLGFAYLDLPNGERVGIVDVPGHEKFIKNMVAGLPGIDIALLIIDAGEGIMPQTKEHIDILTLLGIQHFIIVLTKVGTIDEELRELVMEDIHSYIQGTILEHATIIETDAVEQIGLEVLKEMITKMSSAIENKRNVNASPRLNIDRVFSVKGFGTVVTGTLIEGVCCVGDELIIYPSERRARIRGIQVHEKAVKQAIAGQRTALNIANLSTHEVAKGEVIAEAKQLAVTWMLDVKLTCLPSFPKGLQLWERVRVLIGTKEVMARVVPIGIEQLAAGEAGFLQLRLEEQVAVKAGDHFILRSYSPMRTIGGGVILDANPSKHRRFHTEIIESLQVKEKGSLEDVLADFLKNKNEIFTPVSQMLTYTSESQANIEKILAEWENAGRVFHYQKGWIHHEKYQIVRDKILDQLNAYHKKYRLRMGMPKEEIYILWKQEMSAKELQFLLTQCVKEKKLKECNQLYANMTFNVKLNSYQEKEKARILMSLEKSRFTPIKVEDLLVNNPTATEVLESMADKEVVYLTHEYVLLQSMYQQAIEQVQVYIRKNGAMTLADFRDLTSSSRKSSMLILEALDKANITKRVENKRKLV
ncbi:selenocysteine-specific translation elongation factor [Listeria monocytogenes]|uniref:selenocysteine-specific translation elongation factor n=1 Tax=Listeria monocytogenes TaxID=1639 RepID=UPI0011EAAC88|nr:selenocysteine-specific translation elongation factor [Listeria monocytogenes]EHK4067740.1 selenocysteine-specific translation elongation factor [Listeria monocytogenes]TYV33149.1 selenocysteine-specific translation elongation factor [Listeria monocytogenes]HBC0573991.1 selenocysteine-specific translation elongation factor [Listeria monocytogenes]